LESIDLIVPHQANKTMVTDLALKAGLSEDSLYFNVETVGNASSASIPLAIHDAVCDGVITEPTRIFAPGFGAGAVAGYTVMRIDPAVVAMADDGQAEVGSSSENAQPTHEPSSDDVMLAFG
ncbi:MAG TPA: 3-oxoacyl-[acyl-carrier-protein] synthase III C-terminal domain-containing protein, partial [Dermatophilaceae bacterium]